MARKVKIADSVANHADVNVRLAAQQLIKAIDAAKKGDVSDMATFIRLAAMFERDMPLSAKFGGPILA
jgi:acyl-CoA reductase-like NAD-dependent aldehyde dehydrogenase